MKASELINKLQEVIDSDGDIDVRYFVSDGEFYAGYENITDVVIGNTIDDEKFIWLDIE